ncbi:MAG TPA: proprotein convertase P-domain-containing protein [Dokdonella sp.]|uniref:proprotein convertase P-domain-containing protein n=1 Tax=Dokdonella sp. TaxID=2291710 RepID=UPI002CA600E4|nr:proprotein convertase P-domain-containing protein [Dokdonella sp.]HUD42528.1 proprotein convertase P-domain-containing protein [Dokdonella sp.]
MRVAVLLCVMGIALLAGALGAQPASSELQFSPLPASTPFVESKALPARPRGTTPMSTRVFSSEFPSEIEPNGAAATATPLGGPGYVRMQGTIFPAGDVDYYSFAALAGDRVYAAVVTSADTSSSSNSQLRLIGSDGTTALEFDEDDGSLLATSSSIAGTLIPADGTYYLRVNHSSAAQTLRPYELHFRLQRGAPTPEVESNDTPATANPLPANGWVSGARSPAAATEQDWYSFTANAGDTVFLSLDADPERDAVQWNARLGIALFGDAGNQILVIDDASTGSAANPLSEALVFSIKTAGTYFAFVDSASAATGGPTATYHLSVSVASPPMPLAACTVYTSTDVPRTIGPANGLVSSTITVPGNPRIGDLDVEIVLNHALMADVDAHLRSPGGNDIGLFTDIGAGATGGQQQMDVVFDDEAAIPPTFTVLRGVRLKPEPLYRLAWFDGENAGGTWTLDLRDDGNNANGGTLTGWSLRICEPPPPPTCGPGFVPTTVYATDFESGAAGFTHSGTQDEWELGLPATAATATTNPVAAFNSCASGVNCWKTDLDSTYNVSSNQNLTSPAINLAGLSAPVVVRWSHQYQMESASFDLYSVDLRQVGGAGPVRLFEWLDATMVDAVGNPTVNIPARAGWSQVVARADALAGQNVELNFNLSSDDSVNFAGVAVDDISITACRAATADLAITKTDGVTTATPGGSVTYTITASNAGPDADPAATVTDTFPAAQTCTWTCVGAGGGTCTAAGSGNIADTVVLPSGGSVTYTASCAISAAATGMLANTATVTASVTDPTPANNSATDTDTLTPQADLSITKTDGVTSVTPGGPVTYTIVASNAGPSDAPQALVTDVIPPFLFCEWTCAGAAGGSCTATGSGNINDIVALPVNSSVTYTAACTLAANATGMLVNTATVTQLSGVDPDGSNNSATDTDTIIALGAEISAIKVVSGSFVPGTTVTYIASLTNSGGEQADNPGDEFIDVLPPQLTLVSASSNGGTTVANVATNTVTWNGAIEGHVGGVSVVIEALLSPSATGIVTNQGSFAYDADADGNNESSGVTDDPTLPGAADPTSFTVAGAIAHLSITKTNGVTTVAPGSNTIYTITASNAGPSAVTGAVVSDVFAPILTCTWTCLGSSGSTCTSSGSGNIADAASLLAGGSVTYTANCAVDADAGGNLINTATITAPAGVDDPSPGDNSAMDADFLVAEADLAITKTDGVGSVTPGGSTTYTIVASNAGPSDITGALVTDEFPATLACTWTCAGSSGGTCASGGSSHIADLVNLPAGSSVVYTVACAIDAGASGSLVNTARINVPAGASDPNLGNNSATDTDTLGASADLSITKTDGVASATPGGSTTYTIVAANAGPSAVAGAVVTDTFASTLSCTWICAGSGGGSCTPSGSGNIADPANLPSGASVTYTAVCAIDAGASGSLVNTATIAAPAGVTDPTPGNNSATDTDTLSASADLSITKTDGVATVAAGGTLIYTIVASNAGPQAVTGATVTDTFPASCLAPTWTCAAAGGAGCPASGSGTIAASVDLPSGASVTFTATCPVDPSAAAGSTISNTATIAAPAGTTDPDPSSDSATDTTTVQVPVAGAEVSVRKSVSGSFVPGGAIRYTIVLANAGGAQADNPGDELVDVLPPQLALIAASASSGTATANVGANTVTWNGPIAAGGSVTILIDAAIRAGATGSVSNQAQAAYDGDGDGSNEAAALSDDPGAPGATDPTVFMVGTPVEAVAVPTLGGLAALLLALGLAGLAIAAPRRRLR